MANTFVSKVVVPERGNTQFGAAIVSAKLVFSGADTLVASDVEGGDNFAWAAAATGVVTATPVDGFPYKFSGIRVVGVVSSNPANSYSALVDTATGVVTITGAAENAAADEVFVTLLANY